MGGTGDEAGVTLWANDPPTGNHFDDAVAKLDRAVAVSADRVILGRAQVEALLGGIRDLTRVVLDRQDEVERLRDRNDTLTQQCLSRDAVIAGLEAEVAHLENLLANVEEDL